MRVTSSRAADNTYIVEEVTMFSTLRNTALAGLVSLLPFGAASAAPCTQATLLTYLAGGNATCTVLDKTISGVTAVGGNPAATLVTPLTTTNDPGLDFEGGSAIPTTITFTITAPSNDPITDASL